MSKNDSDMIDYVVVDSKWCEEVFPKGLIYNGNFLRAGAPRCDILYGERIKYRDKFRRQYGLTNKDKIIMFAPTFREDSINGKRTVYSEVWTLDFRRLLRSMETRFGGEWYLCLRVHPQLAFGMKEYKGEELQERLIDVSQEDDMYEILAAMDAFITDYSSAAMDASYTHMPVFIYADDIEKYIKDRGSMLWDLSTEFGQAVRNNKKMTPDMDIELPYSTAQNNDELEEVILNFDEDQYLLKMRQFEETVELVFDGRAGSKVADRLEMYMKQ